jgi:hypothetical protein
MTTADVGREGAPRGDAPAHLQGAPSASPLVSAAWLLRLASWVAVVAAVLGVIVAPGVRGNAGESVVLATDWTSRAVGCFLMGALIALFLEGTLELLRTHELPIAARFALIGGSGCVVVLSGTALGDRMPPPFAVLVASAAIVVTLAGAYCGARAPHTRAIGGVLLAFGFAALARLAAWELATRAGETANIPLFATSRGFATAGVLLEAGGQLLAVFWLSSRGKWAGQLGLTLALLGAAGLTWAVAQGMHSGASIWESIVHSALADAPGVPPPFRFDAFATFLVAASILLALVAAAQPNQVPAVVAAMTLALLSRGAYDVPLRALCAVTSAQWVALACIDGRAMWRTLIADRARRAAEE